MNRNALLASLRSQITPRALVLAGVFDTLCLVAIVVAILVSCLS